MNKYLIIILFFCISSINSRIWCINPVLKEAKSITDSIYTVCDKYPEFNGGKDSLIQYINRSIRYPKEVYKEGILGNVYLRFVVDQAGKIYNINVVRSVFMRTDSTGQKRIDAMSDSICIKLINEARRVVISMPGWNPGIVGGDTVKTWVTLPFRFDIQPNLIDDDETLVTTEEMPQFIGGEMAMWRFLASNIVYPVKAQLNRIQGTCYVRFIIGIDGLISNVSISRSSGNTLLDNEAIRVVSSMPAWIPGKQNGKPVKVSFTAPVSFVLE